MYVIFTDRDLGKIVRADKCSFFLLFRVRPTELPAPAGFWREFFAFPKRSSVAAGVRPDGVGRGHPRGHASPARTEIETSSDVVSASRVFRISKPQNRKDGKSRSVYSRRTGARSVREEKKPNKFRY